MPLYIPTPEPAVFVGNKTITGQILAAYGSAAAPSLSFANSPNLGFYQVSGNMYFSASGTGRVQFSASGIDLVAAGALAWGSTSIGSTPDVLLVRDAAAGVLAQRNGVNAQVFRHYYTYTDASNYGRLEISHTSSNVEIAAQNAGTGADRGVKILGKSAGVTTILNIGSGVGGATGFMIGNGGANLWTFRNTDGEIQPGSDNAYDIGDGTHTIRDLYVGRTLYLSGTREMASNQTIDGKVALRTGQSFNTVCIGQGHLSFGTSGDTYLYRIAARVLEFYGGTSPMTWRHYSTYTDASNYERLAIAANAAADFTITPEAAGTGTLRGLKFGTSGGKLGFFGTTAVTRPVLATGAGATVDNVITALQTLGLVSQT